MLSPLQSRFLRLPDKQVSRIHSSNPWSCHLGIGSAHLSSTEWRLPMKAANLSAMKAPSVLSLCLLALLIGGATTVRAQEYQAGFYFTTLVPRGGFSENITNN